jgi:hypothetical protein
MARRSGRDHARPREAGDHQKPGFATTSASSVSSSRRAPRLVHATWLGSNTGACAQSTNWSAIGEEWELDDEESEDRVLEKGNTFSSKTTSRLM